MKHWKRLLPVLAVILVMFGISLGEILSNTGKLAISTEYKLPSWPRDTVERFARMPVQEDGRIKPVETMAAYKLLRFHGTRTLRLKYADDSRRTLKPTEWLMDVLFYPEKARHYPLFVVDDPTAVSLAGITQPHQQADILPRAAQQPRRRAAALPVPFCCFFAGKKTRFSHQNRIYGLHAAPSLGGLFRAL